MGVRNPDGHGSAVLYLIGCSRLGREAGVAVSWVLRKPLRQRGGRFALVVLLGNARLRTTVRLSLAGAG